MERYWCADCNYPVALDTHGRCADCGSSAVASMELPNRLVEQAAQLEPRVRFWKEELELELMALRRGGRRL